MTPEEHASAVLKNWEDEYYSIAYSALEELIAAAIREHEAEVRKEIDDDAKIVGIDEQALGVRRPSYYDPWKDET